MKRRLISASLSVRIHAANRLDLGCGYREFVTYRRIANALEDLARGRFPRFDKED